jgi:hypothetical protein
LPKWLSPFEDQWFAPGTRSPPIRSETSYVIESQLFAATDEDDAYRIVSGWITDEGFSDSHHDGKGDLTSLFALGIHEIEEIVGLNDLPEAIHELYGVRLPSVIPSEVDYKGAPVSIWAFGRRV